MLGKGGELVWQAAMTPEGAAITLTLPDLEHVCPLAHVFAVAE